jgi:membrane protein
MGWKEFFKALSKEWSTDALGDVAGNLTFAGMLALFPFLIFLLSLAGLLITQEQAQAIIDSMKGVLPSAVIAILADRIHSLMGANNAGVLTLSALIAFWSASGGVAALMRSLNTVYGVKDSRPFWKTRGMAVLMTFAATLLSLLAALSMVVMPSVADLFPEPLSTLVLWLRFPFAALVMMFLWALFFYFLPDVEQEFRFITPGSIAGVALWLAASFGFSLYVSNFGKFEATYGALAGVVVLLLWMWISSQVLLLGAEVNAVLEHKSPEGKRAGAKAMSDNGEDLTKTEKTERMVGDSPSSRILAREGASGRVDGNSQRSPAPRRRNSPGHLSLSSKVWYAVAGLSFVAMWVKSRIGSNSRSS